MVEVNTRKMISITIIQALQVALPNGTDIAPALTILLTGGLVGMSIKNMVESVISDDADEDGSNEEITDGGLMIEEGGDDFDDLGGLESDDMDGFGNDEFGDMEEAGGGRADTDELEHRLDELETEVGSLSSTVNTVRTENEQISESVQEVEENVGKLLDIYEMITRGVNPFANDIDAGMDGNGMGNDSSFGLFDDDDDGEEEEEINDDIVNADAEGFFDEELTEDIGEEEPTSKGSHEDVFPDEGNDDDSFEDDGGTFDETFDSGGQDTENPNSGTSFQDLKDEYESGDAEWAAEEEPEDGTAIGEETVDDLEDGEDDLGDDKLFNDDIDADAVQNNSEEIDAEPEPKPESRPKSISAAEETSESMTASQPTAAGVGKPYLATPPSGYPGDLIAIEWLEYLAQQAGRNEASRAIEYYETIDWIHKDVSDALQKILRGFDDVDGGDGGLTIDHHTQSLRYISQLDDDGDTDAMMLSKLGSKGGSSGLQY